MTKKEKRKAKEGGGSKESEESKAKEKETGDSKEKEEKEEKKEEKHEKKEHKGKKHAEPGKKVLEVHAKFVLDGKNEAHVQLEGCDLGYANLLVEKLLEDKNVDFAAVDYVHPTQRTPLLKVKGKGGVRKLVADALKEVEKELKKLSR